MELENLPINPGTATLSNQSPPVGGFKKIIVMGAGRTGTTAITSVIQELGFFTGVDNKREKPSLENEKLDELLALQQYSQLLDRLSEMASQNNKVVWKSLKLMSNLHIDFVSSLPMDIGIVIVFRDILTTAVRKTIVSDTDLIQEMASAIQANTKLLNTIQLAENNKLLISYEKLMTSTPEVVKSIANFCGDIDPALLASAANKITTKPIKYLKAAADFIEKRMILNLESTICNDAVIFPLSINSSNVKIHGGIYSKKDFHEYFNHLRATRTERLHSITDLTYFDKQLNSHDSDSSIETLSGQSLYCGVLFNHFGHFMSESIHRMWPLRDTKFDHYLFCPFPNEKLANFQIAMFEYMGIPLDRIQLVSSPVRPESLVVPRQASLLGLGCAISSDYIDFLSSIENKFYRVYQSTRDYPEKIYVTRSNNIHTGGYAGESYIEKVLGREGFYIFSPENYSLHEQLAFYRNAELIVFSQGSAIHGLEPLGYLKAKIFVLSRNPGSLANFIPLINARCLSKYAFFDQISVLHPLQWSELKKVPKWTSNLAIVNLDQLIDFVIDNQISELNTFSQDEFWLYEAMDISRYLLNININLTPDLFFSYFIKFRDDILRLSKNPYLQNLKQK